MDNVISVTFWQWTQFVKHGRKMWHSCKITHRYNRNISAKKSETDNTPRQGVLQYWLTSTFEHRSLPACETCFCSQRWGQTVQNLACHKPGTDKYRHAHTTGQFTVRHVTSLAQTSTDTLTQQDSSQSGMSQAWHRQVQTRSHNRTVHSPACHKPGTDMLTTRQFTVRHVTSLAQTSTDTLTQQDSSQSGMS